MAESELYGRQSTIIIDTIELTGHRAIFAVEKTLERDPNTCDLQIYNLNGDQRGQLQELRPKKGATRGIPVKIEAGYQTPSLLWLGDLRTVESTKEGLDWVTRLSSGDGEKAVENGRIKVPMGPRTDVKTALRALVKALGIDKGNLNLVENTIKLRSGGKLFPEGKVLAGPAARILDDITRSADLTWSIQNGALQFIPRGGALPAEAVLLTPETGLIGSPTVDNEGALNAKALIIPDLKPGALVVIESSSVRGQYRVQKATWNGDTHGQDWYVAIEGKRY